MITITVALIVKIKKSKCLKLINYYFISVIVQKINKQNKTQRKVLIERLLSIMQLNKIITKIKTFNMCGVYKYHR